MLQQYQGFLGQAGLLAGHGRGGRDQFFENEAIRGMAWHGMAWLLVESSPKAGFGQGKMTPQPSCRHASERGCPATLFALMWSALSKYPACQPATNHPHEWIVKNLTIYW